LEHYLCISDFIAFLLEKSACGNRALDKFLAAAAAGKENPLQRAPCDPLFFFIMTQS